MNDYKLVRQLKSLQKVKPDKDWVFSVKQDILGKDLDGVHPAQWVAMHRQAFLLGSLAALAVVVVVGVFGLQFIPIKFGRELAQIEYQELAGSLKLFEAKITGLTANIKTVRKTENILVLRAEIRTAIEQGQVFVEQVKKRTGGSDSAEGPKQEVLAALTDVEQALSEMEQANAQAQKEMVERELRELEGTVLTEKQIELFQEAERLLWAGSYPQALEKVIEISQIR